MILIVGAGPSGLALAVMLHQRQVKFQIIEKRRDPTRTSNALAIQARTLEIFSDLGLLDNLLQHGQQLQTFNLFSQQSKLLSVSLKTLPRQCPFALSIPQNLTEKILIDYLTENHIEIKRGVELINLTQHPEQVTVEFSDARKENFDYVIGCDGHHSPVRELNQIRFPGFTLKEHFLMADVSVENNLEKDQIYAFFHPEGALAIISAGKDNIRIIADVTQQIELNQLMNPSLEIMQNLCNQRCGFQLKLHHASWTSGFSVHRKLAEHFRNKRCFLVADAAHEHSPVGGQGMNTGIQDAFNLAWKLAYVTQNKMADSILDSYEIERRPIANEVLNFTTRATKIVSTSNYLFQIIRNTLLKIINQFNFIKTKLALTLSELEITYSQNAWIKSFSNHQKSYIGKRLPNFNNIYQYLTLEKFNLLIIENNIEIKPNDLQKIENYQAILKVVKLPSKMFDENLQGVYIIRPDRYVGFYDKFLKMENVIAYLNQQKFLEK